MREVALFRPFVVVAIDVTQGSEAKDVNKYLNRKHHDTASCVMSAAESTQFILAGRAKLVRDQDRVSSILLRLIWFPR